MQIQQFTEKAQQALQGAHNLAVRFKHPEIGSLHLLLALAEQSEGLVPRLLERLGRNVNALITGVQQRLERLPQVSGGGRKLAASNGFNEALVQADQEAQRFSDEYIST